MHSGSYIAVIDFGSQTTMLIARRIRELGVLAKVLPPSVTAGELAADPPGALVLSGGPSSLCEEGAVRLDAGVFELGLPILGICYGMQLIVDHFGGSIKRANEREFGRRLVEIDQAALLFAGFEGPITVWMSHTDQGEFLSSDFCTIASSTTCPQVAIENRDKKIFGVQFHPEVSHTEKGDQILSNFLFKIALVNRNFDLKDFCTQKVKEIKEQVGSSHVIMGLSGGVDSSVAAVLIHRAIGDQLHCVYVNHGLHRHGEIAEIRALFGDVLDIDLHVVDAREQFFSALAGVTDPEIKRKKIGHAFIEAFEREAEQFERVDFLGQGTLYPDVIESLCKSNGPSHLIKSHHNVGGLPDRMNLKLLEPLRDLFKDEVRTLGMLLGLNESVVMRQPFPGPGLAVRLPGEVTRERVSLLQKADAIVCEEIKRAHDTGELTVKMWQWFAILLPVKSVGVMGDARSYGETIVIRCVDSVDAMTADWAKLPHELLGHMSSRITNEVVGVSRVLYDITQKPPGTIEWE